MALGIAPPPGNFTRMNGQVHGRWKNIGSRCGWITRPWPGGHHADVSEFKLCAHHSKERLFEDSPVTPAVSANDTSDITVPAGALSTPSLRGRSAPPASITFSAAHLRMRPEERGHWAQTWGFTAVTFNNNLERGPVRRSSDYHDFREEAEAQRIPVLPGSV